MARHRRIQPRVKGLQRERAQETAPDFIKAAVERKARDLNVSMSWVWVVAAADYCDVALPFGAHWDDLEKLRKARKK